MHSLITEIENGFNTSIKAFRFEGSLRVRIRCSVNICIEKCKPVNNFIFIIFNTKTKTII